MEEVMTGVTYNRRAQTGVITIKGIVDIFEASQLHTVALKAFNDKKALNVQVNLEKSERLDTAVLQILVGLRESIVKSQRTFELVALPDGVAACLSTLSLPL